MNPTLETLTADLRANPGLGFDADKFAFGLRALDLEGDGRRDAVIQLEIITWIAAQPRPIEDKAIALRRFLNLTGKVYIPNLSEWAGWN